MILTALHKAALIAAKGRRPHCLSFASPKNLKIVPRLSTAYPNLSIAYISSTSADVDNVPPKRHPQSFVDPNIELEPGELSTLPPNFHQHRDPGPLPHSFARNSRHGNDGKDAYWRPPWKSRAEIISAEDFANRPRVSFSEHFETMRDAMVVLSWMSQEDKNGMYELYLNLITAFAGKSKDAKVEDIKNKDWGMLSAHTSHEYIIRVVAQRYNVTTSRAAGVIQLQHNEEQLKKDPNFKVNHELQEHVDNKVREVIRDVYKSYGEKDPLVFTEDPIASTGQFGREDIGSPSVSRASDLLDIDALVKKTKIREFEVSKAKIANHIYVEDVDNRTVAVKIDKEARRWLNSSKKLGNIYETKRKSGDNESADEKEENIDSKPFKQRTIIPTIPDYATPFPQNNLGYKSIPGTRRPRWKYAAQIIDTHALESPKNSVHRSKKVAARIKARRHGRVVEGNTLIEQDGKVRVASVAELEQTSWKHVRNESEFMFRGVKEAWLRRQLEGEVGGWGLQNEINKVEAIINNEELMTESEDSTKQIDVNDDV